jgi:hypothetical protein
VHLEDLDRLRTLDLTATAVTDGSFVHLARLPSLELLVLARTPTTGRGIDQLTALDKLEELDLSWTALSDIGPLSELQQVRYLRVLVPVAVVAPQARVLVAGREPDCERLAGVDRLARDRHRAGLQWWWRTQRVAALALARRPDGVALLETLLRGPVDWAGCAAAAALGEAAIRGRQTPLAALIPSLRQPDGGEWSWGRRWIASSTRSDATPRRRWARSGRRW